MDEEDFEEFRKVVLFGDVMVAQIKTTAKRFPKVRSAEILPDILVDLMGCQTKHGKVS